jgi:FkbM family methyltransferase
MIEILRFIRNHPLTRRAPWQGVWRLLKYQIATRTLDEAVVRWVDDSYLAVSKNMSGASGNIYTGLHEYCEMGFLIHYLQPDELFVDVGANVGAWTVLASAVCGARTMALEPDPISAQRLRRNIEVNAIQRLVEVHEVAASRADGRVMFTVGRDATNRIATPGDAKVREVPSRSLDSLLPSPPEVVKIDVEGFEEEVLAGARSILSAPQLKVLFIEVPPVPPSQLADHPVIRKLAEHGFTRVFYDPAKRLLSPDDNGLRVFDAIFVRDVEESQRRLRSTRPRRIFGGSL